MRTKKILDLTYFVGFANISLSFAVDGGRWHYAIVAVAKERSDRLAASSYDTHGMEEKHSGFG